MGGGAGEEGRGISTGCAKVAGCEGEHTSREDRGRHRVVWSDMVDGMNVEKACEKVSSDRRHVSTASMSAQQGEAATIAMVSAARQIFEAVRAGEPDSSARIQTLHGTYEQQWSLLREAAAALESPAPAVGAGAADAADHEALSEERQKLRTALAARNDEVKQQIDMLRQLLCASQVSGA